MKKNPPKKGPKKSRGNLSTIDLLPEDIRVRLAEALRSRELTQKQIVEHFNSLLAERGAPALSYSAVNRYSKSIEAHRAQMREAQVAAEAIVGGLDEAPESDLGRAVTQIVKSLTFDLVMRERDAAAGEDRAIDPDLLGDIALTIQRLERAASIGQERELKLRSIFEKECSQKLDDAVARGEMAAQAAEDARRHMGFV